MNVIDTVTKDLYNSDIKKSFLGQYLEDDNTRATYAVYLKQASDWEKKIDKDLFEFSREDVLDLFSNSFTQQHTTLRILYSVCKQYGKWTTDRGYNKSGINPFDLVKFRQHILPMLNTKGLYKKYLTEEQVWEVASEAGNYQDCCPLILAFYGVKGSKNIELINLKLSDIDINNNKVTLTTAINENTGKTSTRIIELPKKVIDIILKASAEKEYARNNTNKYLGYVPLAETEYVLKPAIMGKMNKYSAQIKSQTIASRVKKLLVSAKYDNCSINDIFMSGKIETLKKIEKENDGKLDIEDFKLVNMLFGGTCDNYSNLKEAYKLIKESKAE